MVVFLVFLIFAFNLPITGILPFDTIFTVQMKKTSVNKLVNEMGTANVIVNTATVAKKKKKEKKELEVYFLAKNSIILLKAVL